MSRILIIRFGALGDLCLCGWFAAGLADTLPETRIVLATKARFADLAAGFDGVDEVVPLSGRDPGAVWSLARRLRGRRFERLLDAHSVLRSHLLCLLLGRTPDARLRKDTRARLALLRRGGDTAPPPPGLDRTLLDRYTALADDAGLSASVPRPPLLSLRPEDESPRRIAIAPGARWPSKRWPTNRFADLIDLLREDGATEILLILGPDETAALDGGPLADLLRRRPEIEVLRQAPLPEVAAALARCRLAVTNDSGLLHLSEAVGTPVAALFGPTVRAFGYFPRLPGSVVLERELDCRPCSRTGSRPCHRGDLACLENIPAAEVHEAVRARLEGGAT